MQDFFFLKTNGKYFKVRYSDIYYVECIKNYIRIITSKKTFIVSATLKHIVENLPKNRFCKIHRSYIVSLNEIEDFDYKFVNVSGKKLPISDQYREILIGKFKILTTEPRNRIRFSKN